MNKVSKNDHLNGQLATLGPEKVGKGSQRTREADGKTHKATGSSYDVDLSSKSRAMRSQHKKAYDIAKATPGVREKKIAELKAKIQNGTYQVDSGKIADGILKEAIRDHLASSD
ncbi:MAG: flagellar biosynthesis anti-sigma factor FlgM [Oligoflexales bacterium]